MNTIKIKHLKEISIKTNKVLIESDNKSINIFVIGDGYNSHITRIYYGDTSPQKLLNRLNINLKEFDVELEMEYPEENVLNIINWCIANRYKLLIDDGKFLIYNCHMHEEALSKQEAECAYGKAFDCQLKYGKK